MAARRFSALVLSLLIVFAATRAQADDREVVEREVSPKVAERLMLAARAIRFVKKAIPHAGNQHEAIYETKGNSYNRLKVARSTNIASRVESPELKKMAQNDRLAASAATIAATCGGNCGEHSVLAMQYLSELNPNQKLTRASIEGVDHAFVLIGDLQNDPLDEIVVVDAWVMSPQPLVYSDFSFKKERSKITVLSKKGQVGNKTRQARRALTRGLRASFKKNPNPLLKQTIADTKNLKGLWYQEFAAKKNVRYKLKGEGGKLFDIKYSQATKIEGPSITAKEAFRIQNTRTPISPRTQRTRTRTTRTARPRVRTTRTRVQAARAR